MFANHGAGVFRGRPAGILQQPAFLGRVFKQAFEAEPENSNSCVYSVVPGLQQELEASLECTGPREVLHLSSQLKTETVLLYLLFQHHQITPGVFSPQTSPLFLQEVSLAAPAKG